MPTTFLMADLFSRATLDRFAYSAQPQAPVRAPTPRRGLRRHLSRVRPT